MLLRVICGFSLNAFASFFEWTGSFSLLSFSQVDEHNPNHLTGQPLQVRHLNTHLTDCFFFKKCELSFFNSQLFICGWINSLITWKSKPNYIFHYSHYSNNYLTIPQTTPVLVLYGFEEKVHKFCSIVPHLLQRWSLLAHLLSFWLNILLFFLSLLASHRLPKTPPRCHLLNPLNL